MSMGQNS